MPLEGTAERKSNEMQSEMSSNNDESTYSEYDSESELETYVEPSGATREEVEKLSSAYASVVNAYREAAQQLRERESSVSFPEGTFPSPQAFVPLTPQRAGP